MTTDLCPKYFYMQKVKNNNVMSWISKARVALGKEYSEYCTE